MHIIRGIAVAFSTYSKIPMPQFVWKEEDMRYSMCFFPWIGAVIGAILWGWFRLSALLGISTLAFILISAALPLIITGGFHVDGFMDTMDALHSYQPRERKLEILKDSHIGAFSVIKLAEFGLIYVAALSQIVLLWIFPVPLPERPECGLLPFRKNGWDALSFCEYRT